MPDRPEPSGNGTGSGAPPRVQMNFRIEQGDLDLLRRAAKIEDRTVSSFTRQAAKEAARRVVAAAG